MILHGNSLERLKEFPDNYFHSIVTDPPYGLSFMGKKWDYDVPSIELWKEALRVLKPGGFLLSFGGTRTYHRMVVNIEDAGFEIRDQIMWVYGSGFPKSMDISKAIDKAAGAEREVVGKNKNHRESAALYELGFQGGKSDGSITAPSTDEAKQWQGWGTALKPANEPIVVARKPLSESTVAKNVLKHSTGGINIDGSRIGTETIKISKGKGFGDAGIYGTGINTSTANTEHQGRWPANLIFDEEAAETLPLDSQGESVSRYFYIAKASKRERNAGLEGMPLVAATSKQQNSKGRMENGEVTNERPDEPKQQNFHPTVKPIKLMEYLIKLVTPPGGIVLDPFCGSGSTGVAAKRLGFGFVGIEMSAEYVEIAKRRIEA